MLTIDSSSDVKQISTLFKSVGAKEENGGPPRPRGSAARRPTALTAMAQGRVSSALTHSERAPSVKVPEGSDKNTERCAICNNSHTTLLRADVPRHATPLHTVQPFSSQRVAKKFAVLRCSRLQTCRNMPHKNWTRLSQHRMTPTSVHAQDQPGVPNTLRYKMIGNINVNLYFKFTAFYLQKQAGGKRFTARSLSGGVCFAPCSMSLFLIIFKVAV